LKHVFDKNDDWKDKLPEDTRKILTELIGSIKKNRYAYENADDSQIAQLWVALAEIKKV
jgi:hypothetical protein